MLTDTSNIRYSQNIDMRKVYDQLQQRSNNNRLTRELYNQLIKYRTNNIVEEFVSGTNVFDQYRDKKIASIDFKRLDIFGPSIFDTTLTTDKKYEQFINKTHIHSREKHISNALLFKVGDAVSPNILSDNERILRDNNTIHEAKILVSINETDTNKVDILVLTQDAFPIQVGGQVYDVNRGRIDVNHTNIGGTGHKLINRLYYDGSDRKRKGYFGTYKIPNIYKSFIASEIDYHNLFYKKYYGIRLYRDFFTPEIKYAGATSIYFYDEQPELLIDDTLLRRQLDYRITDAWIGRNFKLQKDVASGKLRHGLNFSVRYTLREFDSRPEIYRDSASYYYNYLRFLGKIGYSSQKFYESNMIYSSGKTEDIPIGFLLEFLAGTELDDFEERGYIGSTAAFAATINKKYYWYNRVQMGTYFNSLGFEQGVFRCYSKAFSPLIKTNGPLIRQFLTIGYTQGFNLKAHEYIGLDNKYGLRSWNKRYPIGNYRFTLSAETVIFPKWYYYGMGSTVFAFFDMGTVGDNIYNIFETKAYSSIGMGFRLRNDNFVVNSIEIRLSWFPVVPEGKHWAYYISSEQTLNLNKLTPEIPEIVPFE